jgi:predicted DNA-binding transcriptional regulator AlpA
MQVTFSERQVIIPATGFVRLAQILTVIPIGKTSWWNGVKSGRFPKSVKLSPRCTAWKAEDIHALIKKVSESGLKNGLNLAD